MFQRHCCSAAFSTASVFDSEYRRKIESSNHGGLWSIWLDQRSGNWPATQDICLLNQEEAWKWSNVKRKTDKDDALKLARMAAMGELTSVRHPVRAKDFQL